jgi:hypothetical protein
MNHETDAQTQQARMRVLVLAVWAPFAAMGILAAPLLIDLVRHAVRL